MLRRFLSALSVLALLTTLAAGECVACGAVAAIAKSGDCCNPDGSCKTAPAKYPTRCLKAHHAEQAVVEQAALVVPVAAVDTAVLVVLADCPRENPVSVSGEYSPPDIFLLNSVFLI